LSRFEFEFLVHTAFDFAPSSVARGGASGARAPGKGLGGASTLYSAISKREI